MYIYFLNPLDKHREQEYRCGRRDGLGEEATATSVTDAEI